MSSTPSPLLSFIDALWLRVRESPFCYRFTLLTRLLLAAGFIPTGMVKLLGRRFTTLSVESPVGAFFEAMFQTGLYWQFLGASQVLAGMLLLFPRMAHLGAALFLPIMVNIVVITVSIPFRGTPVVTGLMLLAVVYLCAWDWERFRPLLTTAPRSPATKPRTQRLDVVERAGFTVVGLALSSFFLMSRSFLPAGAGRWLILVGMLAGLATFGRYLTTTRRSRLGDASHVGPGGDRGGAAPAE